MKKKSLLIMDRNQLNNIYGEEEISRIKELTELIHSPMTAAEAVENTEQLKTVEIIFSGWGMTALNPEFLKKASSLEAVFYGAGSVKNLVSPAMFDRGIVITSSWKANAVPVAEFTFAQIILNLKKTYQFMKTLQKSRDWDCRDKSSLVVPGCYGSTVGLVSLGMIGSLVLKFLKTLDVRIQVFDINLTSEAAEKMGVERCSLEQLFTNSDVISLHTAYLPETRGMINGKLIRSMKQGATLINTARGGLIREAEMIQVLRDRPDLSAVLDVTFPEPPRDDSLLFELPNIYLTPHIAGSFRMECRRMGQLAINEARCWLNNEPLRHRVSPEMLKTMA